LNLQASFYIKRKSIFLKRLHLLYMENKR
jgi:hypothetical protein